MSQQFAALSLFYRPKWRKDEAAKLAAGIGGIVKFREARLFQPNDVEFKFAKVNQPRVNYDRVLVLAGSPNLEDIVEEYAEYGVTVEVVSADKAPAADAPAAPGAPERPNYKKMRKDALRRFALKEYGFNAPLDWKVAQLREYLEGQPWPPKVMAVEGEAPEDEL